MSTVTFTRSSSAASHHAIVLPIEMPSVAMRDAIDVGPLDEEVERAQAVVDHHSPQHLTLPQHGLERVGFGRVAALAEDPVVDGERDVAETGEFLRVRDRLQIAATVNEFQLADLVAAAMRVVEEHRGNRVRSRPAVARDTRGPSRCRSGRGPRSRARSRRAVPRCVSCRRSGVCDRGDRPTSRRAPGDDSLVPASALPVAPPCRRAWGVRPCQRAPGGHVD